MRLIDASLLEDMAENLITSAKRNVVMAADLSDVEREKYATQLIEREEFRRMLLSAPTVDDVEVTRCRDCVYMEKQGNARFCKVWFLVNGYGDDGFCCYGDKKEEK